jgi:acetyltransferase-like isoleucine patch superfamily enzyme
VKTVDEVAGPPAPSTIDRVVSEVRDGIRRSDGKRLAWHTATLLPDFAFPRLRARLLAAVGCSIERGVGVLGYVHLIGPPGCARNLRIGTGSVIGPGVRFCLDAEVVVGANVSIGPSVMLYTAMHMVGDPSRRMQPEAYGRPIVIEDGAWIALGAMILPGVRVGQGAVVAAGAVVTSDVPANVLVAGNPAEVVHDLSRPSPPTKAFTAPANTAL